MIHSVVSSGDGLLQGSGSIIKKALSKKKNMAAESNILKAIILHKPP
jgi:hypothetical protein